MDPTRRDMIRAGGLLAALAAGGAFSAEPGAAPALAWNRAAFEAKTVADALKALGAVVVEEGADLQLTVPEIAEDGAVVPVVVRSLAAGTQAIHLLVDKNPFSLAASFSFPDGTEPAVSTRIKMNETSDVVAVAVAGGSVHLARRSTKVTIGGCGG
jgi:sulfur-oxidizing protein SoxY